MENIHFSKISYSTKQTNQIVIGLIFPFKIQ